MRIISKWFTGAIWLLFVLTFNFTNGQTENCVEFFDENPHLSGIGSIALVSVDMQETDGIGTNVYTLSWDDSGTPGDLRGEEFLTYFEVDASTDNQWVFFLKESLVGLPDYNDIHVGELILESDFAGFAGFEGLCKFSIKVTIHDENTQDPKFDMETYKVDLQEDLPVNFYISDYLTINIIDDDGDSPNNDVDVSLDESCPLVPDPVRYDKFEGQSEAVQLKIKDHLDYEQKQQHLCTVTITDNGDPPRTDTASLEITVVDVPDQPPVFSSPFYSAELTSPEPEEGGTELSPTPEAITAIDGDTGHPTTITFEMMDFDDAIPGTDYFEIDPSTGVVSLTKILEDDILEHGYVIFIIKATEVSGEFDNSVLQVLLPPVPTTTPEPTTSTTPEPTTSTTASTTESSTSQSTTDTTGTTTPTEQTQSTTDSTTTSISTDPTTSSMTDSTTTSGSTESTTSSMTISTTTSGSTDSTTSSMTDSTITSGSTDVTTSIMTESTTTSESTTSTPERSIEFHQDTYSAETYAYFGTALKVDVITKGVEGDDVVFTLEGEKSDSFQIESPSGKISPQNDPPPGLYELTVKAEVGDLHDNATVNIRVLPSTPENIDLPESLHLAGITENVEGQSFLEFNGFGPIGYICISNVEPEDYKDSFETVEKESDKWEVKLKANEYVDFEKTREIRFRIQAFENDTAECPDKLTDSLLRNEAQVVVDIEEKNDNKPRFVIPKEPSEFIAFPKDLALQRVIGPIITLQAEDEDLDSTLTYSITNADSKFYVEDDTGCIYSNGDFDCGDEGCQITVAVSDGDYQQEDETIIHVKSLDMSNIYTMTLKNIRESEVEDELEKISTETDFKIGKLYVENRISVTSEVQASYSRSARYFKYSSLPEHSGSPLNTDDEWQLKVNVYAVNGDGNIVSFDDFNKKLTDTGYEEAETFIDANIFDPDDSDPSGEGQDTTGLIVGISILAVLLAIVLGVGGFLMYRQRKVAKPKQEKNISTVGGAYPNHSFSDDENEVKSTVSKKSNGYINGTIRSDKDFLLGDMRDSPPLHRSGLSEFTESSKSESKAGLRRTDPGKPEYYGISSREPPPSYSKSHPSFDEKPVTAVPDKVPSMYPSISSSTKETTEAQPSYLAKNPKKAPPPLNSAPARSILRGKGGGGSSVDSKQDGVSSLYSSTSSASSTKKYTAPKVPADSKADFGKDDKDNSKISSLKSSPTTGKKGGLKPDDPDKDYNSEEESHTESSFSDLNKHFQGSPKLKIKGSKSQTSDSEEDSQSDVKKSNLKMATIDSESEDEKKSVAFKVLVETKVIQPENQGPAMKAKAQAVAKSDALDILEANKKKIEEKTSDEGDEESSL